MCCELGNGFRDRLLGTKVKDKIKSAFTIYVFLKRQLNCFVTRVPLSKRIQVICSFSNSSCPDALRQDAPVPPSRPGAEAACSARSRDSGHPRWGNTARKLLLGWLVCAGTAPPIHDCWMSAAGLGPTGNGASKSCCNLQSCPHSHTGQPWGEAGPRASGLALHSQEPRCRPDS